jgi:hypothetical protein
MNRNSALYQGDMTSQINTVLLFLGRQVMQYHITTVMRVINRKHLVISSSILVRVHSQADQLNILPLLLLSLLHL